MSKKHINSLNNKKLLELKVSDGLTNLEELTRSMSENIDFDSFDILSITRTDVEQPYTRQYANHKVETKPSRTVSNFFCYLFPQFCKLKLN
ncbi:MAG: hypothetical protein AMJ55_06860 [Gammaproteobacteria bacterium SG8_15]|nr:MAG: hypothetical protein AMJ55_06860 [Gammaproteobacteria bacterium SG8_15]